MRNEDEDFLNGTPTLLEYRSNYGMMFTNLMDKFLIESTVTAEEMSNISKLYQTICELIKALDEDLQAKILPTIPPLTLLEKFYKHQQSGFDKKDENENENEDEDEDEEESFDSNGSEKLSDYLRRLAHKIEALFAKNPIQNLPKMLDLYKKYIGAIDDASKDAQAFLPKDIDNYLYKESRRVEKEEKLCESIENYKTQKEKILKYFNELPDDVIGLDDCSYIKSELKALKDCENEIEDKYGYYLTTKHRALFSESSLKLQEVGAFIKKGPSETQTKGIAFTTRTESENDGSSLSYSSYSSEVTSLLGCPISSSPVHINTTPSSKTTMDNGGTIKHGGPLTTIHEVDSNSSNSSSPDPGKASLSPEKKVTFQSVDEIIRIEYNDATDPSSTSVERPKISSSLWFLAAVSSSAIVAGIVLIALASSITSPIGIAGLACMAVGGITACSLAFFARSRVENPLSTPSNILQA